MRGDAVGQILRPDPARRRVIALDGKTQRGSAPRSTPEQVALARSGGGRTHLVAACDHASGVTLGQVACADEVGQGGEVAAAQTAGAHLRQPWTPGNQHGDAAVLSGPVPTGPCAGLPVRRVRRPRPGDCAGLLRRTTLDRQPSTPIAVGTTGPRLPAYPWPFGDPAGTVRVGAAEIVGPLYLFPGTDAMRGHVEQYYRLAVVAAETDDFAAWINSVAGATEAARAARTSHPGTATTAASSGNDGRARRGSFPGWDPTTADYAGGPTF